MSKNFLVFWAGFAALFILFLWLFQSVLAPFVTGMIVAYFMNPLVSGLEKYKIPRVVGSILLIIVFLAVSLLLMLLLIPALAGELAAAGKALPGFLMHVKDQLIILLNQYAPQLAVETKLETVLQDRGDQIAKATANVAAYLYSGGLAVLSVVSFIVLMPIVAFYFMADWPRLSKNLHGLIPRHSKKTITNLWGDIDSILAAFIRGQLTICFLLGGFYALMMVAVGLNYGILIGFVAGLFSIIPMVGSIIGLLVSVGVAFFQFDGWMMPAIVAAIFFAGQLMEGNVITPKIMGDSIHLHPLWILFALMAGGSLLGFTGLLLAVPVAAVAGVIVRFAIQEYKSSPFYKQA